MKEIELMPQVSVIMFYLPSFINRLWTGLPHAQSSWYRVPQIHTTLTRIKYKLYQH